MSQRIYFSGVGEPDLWNSRFLTGVSKQMLGFLTWDATPDLAQASWEWPEWKGCPTDQMYYWSAEWQRGERESLKALREGDYVTFDGSDPDEVAQWFAS